MRIRTIVWGLTALAVLPIAASAQAQDQTNSAHAQGRASATVLEPLTVVAKKELSFGAFTIAEGNGGEITVGNDGADARFTGGLSPVCQSAGPCSVHPALFAVSGESDRHYGVALPQSLALIGARGGPQLQIQDMSMRSETASSQPMSGQLNSDGQDQFSVGGRLFVPGNARPDRYRGELTVTISYN